MDKLDGKTMDIVKDNIEKLKELFPSIVKEDKIDFEELELLLGENINRNKEQYSFVWNGKTEATKLAQKRSLGTLRPCKEESKDWDTTKNLYIEGDNLEVLKLLQTSYNGRIKMIYIDPPYNTGHDFVYKDNFEDNIANYKEITGQAQKSNADTDGRYHTNWLNMMYPRLKLARTLLSDDGAIFVSIDYNEFANLKKIMDDVFGEDNFQREIIWRIGWLSGYKTTAPNFIRNHDTILFYSKNSSHLDFIKKYIENKDFKPLVKKDGKLNSKLSELGLSDKQQNELLNFINYENRPDKYPIEDTWNSNEYDDLNSIAIVSFSGEKISKVLDIDQDFKGQKSIKMMKRILEATTKENDIVLDFFSGSASTAHAVIQQNAEDGGNRSFICVQLPELTEAETKNAGYENICEIAKERIRRVGNRIKQENPAKDLDVGFKVFKLDNSNLRKWNNEPTDNVDEVAKRLQLSLEYLEPNRTDLDLVYEIMLKHGIDLTKPVVQTQNGKGYIIEDDDYKLLICAYRNLTLEDIESFVNENVGTYIFADHCFADDNLLINTQEMLKAKGREMKLF